eukprot:COSAG01_NODE_34112_length_553_cov_0.762115_1_plen_103_part_10
MYMQRTTWEPEHTRRKCCGAAHRSKFLFAGVYVAIVTTLSIFDARYIGPHTWKSYGEEPSPGCVGESSIMSKSTELTLSTEHTMHVHRQSVRRIGSVQLVSKG